MTCLHEATWNGNNAVTTCFTYRIIIIIIKWWVSTQQKYLYALWTCPPRSPRSWTRPPGTRSPGTGCTPSSTSRPRSSSVERKIFFKDLEIFFKIMNREIPWQRRCRRARSISTWGGRWRGRWVGSWTPACRGPRPRWRQIRSSSASHSTFQLSRTTNNNVQRIRECREYALFSCSPGSPGSPHSIMLPSHSSVSLNTQHTAKHNLRTRSS